MVERYARGGRKTKLAEAFSDGKYNHPAQRSRLASMMSESVVACVPKSSLVRSAGFVVPLPSSRGLSRLLARELAVRLSAASAPDTLRWCAGHRSVKNVPVADRAAHVAETMIARQIRGGVVLLVDDTVQSGATLAEAARACRAAGADDVVAAALLWIH